MIGTGNAAQRGILVKDAEALEIAHKIKAIILDKTGTLTRGKPELTDIKPYEMEENEVLRIAASLEMYSEHHLAKPIIEKAKAQKLEFLEAKDFEAVAGKGVRGKLAVDGQEVLGVIGNRALMKETNISGIKSIEQVLVVKRENNYVVLTAGTNLKEILEFKGVSREKTTTNDIHEVNDVLGIEAARQAIMNEVKKVIEQQGLDIDERHIKLVADAMCTSGSVKGITRMGIISDKSSILARASFETPVKHFVNATVKANVDELASVVENIILNQPIPVGTGLPGLLVQITGSLAKKETKEAAKEGKEKK